MSSGHIIPKCKNKPSEDAVFTSTKALGVADGVGGWATMGIDSSKFSNELLRNFAEEVKTLQKSKDIRINSSDSSTENFDDFSEAMRSHSSSENFDVTAKMMLNRAISSRMSNIKSILGRAYRKVKSYGSSTACVCTLDKNTLNVANLGDSGFMLLRYYPQFRQCKLVKKSKEQQHTFNAPYQLAHLPLNKLKGKNITSFWSDDSMSADCYRIEVKSGDILLMGSDGLFDNLYTKDIIRICNKFLNKEQREFEHACFDKFNYERSVVQSFDSEDASILAKRLAAKAYQNSISCDVTSPFGEKVNELLRKKGKQKD